MISLGLSTPFSFEGMANFCYISHSKNPNTQYLFWQTDFRIRNTSAGNVFPLQINEQTGDVHSSTQLRCFRVSSLHSWYNFPRVVSKGQKQERLAGHQHLAKGSSSMSVNVLKFLEIFRKSCCSQPGFLKKTPDHQQSNWALRWTVNHTQRKTLPRSQQQGSPPTAKPGYS